MQEFDDILRGLAEALELERELGVRTVEIDRDLLSGNAKSVRVSPVDAISPSRPVDAKSVRVPPVDAISPSRPVDAKSVRVPPVDAISPSRPVDAKSVRVPPVDAKSVRVPDTSSRILPLVFLHDRALSPKGVEMMAKIVTALHQTPETAPVLFTGTRPAARVTVVLGHRALRAWFPGAAGAPGQWISPDGVPNVLVTYSPEYVLRFGTTSPAVMKLKREMWTSLKGAMQRLL